MANPFVALGIFGALFAAMARRKAPPAPAVPLTQMQRDALTWSADQAVTYDVAQGAPAPPAGFGTTLAMAFASTDAASIRAAATAAQNLGYHFTATLLLGRAWVLDPQIKSPAA